MTSSNNAKLVQALADLIEAVYGSGTASVSVPEAVEVVPENEYTDWTIKQLRTELIERDYSESDVKSSDKATCIETLLNDDADADDDSDEDDDTAPLDEDDDDDEEEDDEDDEAESTTREQAEELGLVALKRVAIAEHGWTREKLAGYKKPALLAELFAEDDDADDADADDDEDEDDDDAWYDEEGLGEMSRSELVDIADVYGIDYPVRAKESKLIALILAYGEEAADDDEDE